MLEYCLIAVVVGLVVLFAMSRFGGTVSRRYDCSDKTLETAKISDGSSRVRPGCDEQAAASQPAPPEQELPKLSPEPVATSAPPLTPPVQVAAVAPPVPVQLPVSASPPEPVAGPPLDVPSSGSPASIPPPLEPVASNPDVPAQPPPQRAPRLVCAGNAGPCNWADDDQSDAAPQPASPASDQNTASAVFPLEPPPASPSAPAPPPPQPVITFLGCQSSADGLGSSCTVVATVPDGNPITWTRGGGDTCGSYTPTSTIGSTTTFSGSFPLGGRCEIHYRACGPLGACADWFWYAATGKLGRSSAKRPCTSLLAREARNRDGARSRKLDGRQDPRERQGGLSLSRRLLGDGIATPNSESFPEY